MWTVVRAANLVPVPWRNGQGITRDVVTRLAPDGSLDWQVSIADLAGETGFSDFTSYDRVFTPISEGVELAFGGGMFVPCPLLAPVPFAGEQPVWCRVAAPARAFNAIARRPRPIAVDVLRLAAGEAVPVPNGTVVLHCWDGSVHLDGRHPAAQPTLEEKAPAASPVLHGGDSAHGNGRARALADAVVLRVVTS